MRNKDNVDMIIYITDDLLSIQGKGKGKRGSMENTILVAEDDEDIIELLRIYLENEGYRILTAVNGVEAYELVEKEKIDLAIVDIMMPKMNGYELTKKIRQHCNIPIIILSAKNQDTDKIFGLNLGADDYIAKPFNPLEVTARVKSNLRRFYNLNEKYVKDQKGIVRLGELELNLAEVAVYKNGVGVELTPMEYKILTFLMQSPGRVYTKRQIYESICGEYFEADDNTIMVHISNIRDKIENDTRNPVYLKTVRGLGYKIEKNIK